MEEEQERCFRCKGRKFDPPKRKCDEPTFHWLLAGREWTKDGDGEWKATETRETRKAAFDGLLKKADAEREAETIGTVTLSGDGLPEQTFQAKVVDGELKLVRVADSEVA